MVRSRGGLYSAVDSCGISPQLSTDDDDELFYFRFESTSVLGLGGGSGPPLPVPGYALVDVLCKVYLLISYSLLIYIKSFNIFN